jgi:hypothetical protein
MPADTAFDWFLADLLDTLPATVHGAALAVIERHQGATLYINAEHTRQARVARARLMLAAGIPATTVRTRIKAAHQVSRSTAARIVSAALAQGPRKTG